MKRAVIYYRISTPAQNERSQLEDLKRWGTEKGYTFDPELEVFGDVASGYDPVTEREEFERMKEYVVVNEIKNVLVWEVSRMSRKLVQTLQHIEFFNKHNVNVFFKKEDLQTLSGGDLNDFTIKLLSLMADMEGRLIKDRTQRGRMQSALDGKRINYSFLPLGYTVDENNYIILDEKEVFLVKEIFDMSIGGMSTPKIAKELNERGELTFMAKQGKGKVTRKNGKTYDVKWSAKTIQNIIESSRYKGYRVFRGETIKIPRIVSDEVWEEANRKLKERIGSKTRVKHNYLLVGKLVCGHCSYSLRVRRKVKYENKEIFYYYCDSQVLTGEPKCNTGRFDAPELDRHIYDNLILGIIMMQSRKFDSSKEKVAMEKRKKYWQVQKDNFNDEKQRNINLYRKRHIDENVYDKEHSRLTNLMNNADSEIKRLEIAIQDFATANTKSDQLMKKYYWDTNFIAKQSMVKEYLQKVVCYRVNNINFDITEYYRTYYEHNSRTGKIRIIKADNFREPVVNGVIYYVEIFTYFQKDPIKAIVSSARDINFSPQGLKYNKETKKYTAGESPLVYDIKTRTISLNNSQLK
jgi:site-specific DNA recombinase